MTDSCPYISECYQTDSSYGLIHSYDYNNEVSFNLYMSVITFCADTEKIFRLKFMYIAW